MAKWTRKADEQMDLIPNGPKLLLDLAKQYQMDVEDRLATLEEEKSELPDDPEVTGDIADQIGHWQATLAQIKSVLQRVGNA